MIAFRVHLWFLAVIPTSFRRCVVIVFVVCQVFHPWDVKWWILCWARWYSHCSTCSRNMQHSCGGILAAQCTRSTRWNQMWVMRQLRSSSFLSFTWCLHCGYDRWVLTRKSIVMLLLFIICYHMVILFWKLPWHLRYAIVLRSEVRFLVIKFTSSIWFRLKWTAWPLLWMSRPEISCLRRSSLLLLLFRPVRFAISLLLTEFLMEILVRIKFVLLLPVRFLYDHSWPFLLRTTGCLANTRR